MQNGEGCREPRGIFTPSSGKSHSVNEECWNKIVKPRTFFACASSSQIP